MKKLAFATAGIFLAAPVLAGASQPSQPTQAPTGSVPVKAAPVEVPSKSDEPASTQAPAPAAKNGGQADTSCITSGKTSNGDAKSTHPSARVGKDTGELPAPRKKPLSDSSCSSQLDQLK